MGQNGAKMGNIAGPPHPFWGVLDPHLAWAARAAGAPPDFGPDGSLKRRSVMVVLGGRGGGGGAGGG